MDWIGKSPAKPDQTHKCLESILKGDDIKEELHDMRTKDDLAQTIETCSEDAKKLVGKCPIFFFGGARQGKSTMINDLLQAFGSEKRPATEDDRKACTRDVKLHKGECNALALPGVEVKEELLLFDTEGWKLGKKAQASGLLKKCMDLAKKEEEIGELVLHHRLVLVLVLGAENCHELYDSVDDFLDLIKEVCDQAKKAADKAQGAKPVLLPVVSKYDLFPDFPDSDEIQKETGNLFQEILEDKVGKQMDVREPVLIGEYKKVALQERKCIQKLKDTLSKICKEQLASSHIMRAVQVSMETRLLEELQEWQKEGIDSPYSLARRWLWIVARHRNLRVRNLFEDCPELGWEDAQKKADVIRKFGWEEAQKKAKVSRCFQIFQGSAQKIHEGQDEWHSDPARALFQKEKGESRDAVGILYLYFCKQFFLWWGRSTRGSVLAYKILQDYYTRREKPP